mgnify:CR=1 FL=1
MQLGIVPEHETVLLTFQNSIHVIDKIWTNETQQNFLERTDRRVNTYFIQAPKDHFSNDIFFVSEIVVWPNSVIRNFRKIIEITCPILSISKDDFGLYIIQHVTFCNIRQTVKYSWIVI